MMQGMEVSVTGLVRFFSKDELRRYLKSLVDQYQAQNQKYGDHLGGLLRTLEQEKAAAKAQPKDPKDKAQANVSTPARGWARMGSLLVNISDPNGAMAEVLFQLHEEAKTRLAKTTEALRSFEQLSSQTIPEAGQYYLQLKNGVPERLVVDAQQAKKEAFNFSADFKLV